MKSHSPQLERRYELKPEAEAMLADDPVWRRIWSKLLTPINERQSEQRINERLNRYTESNAS